VLFGWFVGVPDTRHQAERGVKGANNTVCFVPQHQGRYGKTFSLNSTETEKGAGGGLFLPKSSSLKSPPRLSPYTKRNRYVHREAVRNENCTR
jgi:hypothetical protein